MSKLEQRRQAVSSGRLTLLTPLTLLALALSAALATMSEGRAQNVNNTGNVNTSFAWLDNGSGTITSVTNSGTVVARLGVIANGGTIGSVDNSGTLATYGRSTAILNTGSIGSITNSGSISGDYVFASFGSTGISNSGTIGNLNNSGELRGTTALYLAPGSTLTSFTNSGTIYGAILNSSAAPLTINGGTGASVGTLTGNSRDGREVGRINSEAGVIFASGNHLLNDIIDAGSGTVTNAATLQINNPIAIYGNFVQNAGATLIFGGGDSYGFGSVLVNGNATFAAGSTISLKPLNYHFAQGQRYVVVTASGTVTVNGVTYSAPGFSVSGAVQDNSLVLTLGRFGLGSGGSVPVNSATNDDAASSLHGLFNYSGTNTSLLALFNPAAALDTADAANKAGEMLSPASIKGAANDAQGVLNQVIGNVANDHMDGLRVAQGNGNSSNSGVATGEAVRDFTLWGQVFGGGASQGLRDNISGYHANYRGLLIGGDSLVSDTLRIGALVNAAKTSLASDGDNTGSSVNINNYGVTAYASYSGSPWYVNTQAGFAHQQYSTTRVINYTGFNGVASGSFNGRQYMTSVQAGYPLALDAWLSDATLTPIAGLSYSTLRQDGYVETGGNGAALKVDASSVNSLKSELGAKLERGFETSSGKLAPSLQLGWRHEYRGGRTHAGASFAADSTGSTAFVTQGAAPVADIGVLTLGMTLLQGKQLNLTARYTLESGGGYRAQTGSLQARWQY
ncbi:autotransporter domain-containing protein [Herbaspirillum sp. NPDC101397]|uniref:autotransporter family protein n=1 Tax=Herbaspirillum sp. NPDC101397 TaxID=3364006 RepID=UPI00383A5A67